MENRVFENENCCCLIHWSDEELLWLRGDEDGVGRTLRNCSCFITFSTSSWDSLSRLYLPPWPLATPANTHFRGLKN